MYTGVGKKCDSVLRQGNTEIQSELTPAREYGPELQSLYALRGSIGFTRRQETISEVSEQGYCLMLPLVLGLRIPPESLY